MPTPPAMQLVKALQATWELQPTRTQHLMSLARFLHGPSASILQHQDPQKTECILYIYMWIQPAANQVHLFLSVWQLLSSCDQGNISMLEGKGLCPCVPLGGLPQPNIYIYIWIYTIICTHLQATAIWDSANLRQDMRQDHSQQRLARRQNWTGLSRSRLVASAKVHPSWLVSLVGFDQWDHGSWGTYRI